MRDTFVRTLITLAKSNPNIELFTGDLGFGVLKPFWEQLPDQFVNAGIAEQNMTAAAAGAAAEGKIVFTYSIGNFPTLRCLEQIRNDCAYHDANVKIVCVGGGFVYGSLGMSHQATEDIAVMRARCRMLRYCVREILRRRKRQRRQLRNTREHVTCGLGAAGKNVSTRILKISKSDKPFEYTKVNASPSFLPAQFWMRLSVRRIFLQRRELTRSFVRSRRLNLSTVKPYCAVQRILKLSQSLKNTIF